ncbi:Putative flagellar basal body P-ring biosynthesis protein FlgA [Pseudomonas knackmussii B13]|uniref:Flagella basal body P-ring formation protein FlgA n=1 Tax=Pseudomonas knackmussii (strain DSM 6978 / CCUG 54928 / LMG 23759 / B13) TaxID=1301098 RepID=A0A024HGW6_PSEKB|nr:Putative flagellar basal body P-ring biosynthesis protein FlgA [Pseudomonas knackmussii B13]
MPILRTASKTLISLTFSQQEGQQAQRRLPLSRRPATAGGKAISALFLLFAGLCCAPVSEAADGVRAQVEQAVNAQLSSQLADEAQRNGWQGARSQFSHELLGALPPTPCATPLQVLRRSEEPSALARQRYEVRCGDGWSLVVSSQAEVFLPVLVTGAVLERGHTLEAGDLQLKTQNIARAHHGFYVRADQVLGQALRRRVRAGQLLTPALLTEAAQVKRGQQVRISASRDGIQASMPGEAMANGQQGEVIKVRNLSSQKVIQAKVIDAGVVSSTFE